MGVGFRADVGFSGLGSGPLGRGGGGGGVGRVLGVLGFFRSGDFRGLVTSDGWNETHAVWGIPGLIGGLGCRV